MRWLVIVVAVMALLTAGWPLLDMAVSDGHPVAAGSRLTVGTEPGSSGVVTVGAGWAMLRAESNPMQGYLLQRNRVELSIERVALLGRSQLPRLWAGLRQILSLRHPDVRLTRPVLITGAAGLREITGGVATGNLIGTATIVPSRSGEFGIEMVLLAPRGTGSAMRIAAIQIMRSLRFTMAGR
jgi:hypothetical protein